MFKFEQSKSKGVVNSLPDMYLGQEYGRRLALLNARICIM